MRARSNDTHTAGNALVPGVVAAGELYFHGLGRRVEAQLDGARIRFVEEAARL